MKKYLISLLTIMMVALVSMSFVSCSDDDDDNGGSNSSSDSSIVGTWKYDFSEEEDGEFYVGYQLFTFNADGTGRLFEYDDGKIDSDDVFTYTCYENVIKIKYIEDDYTEYLNFAWVDKNTILLKDYDGGDVIMKRVK